MSNEKKQKPMLFGNVQLDAHQLEDLEKYADMGFDNSYVPGYGEARIEAERMKQRGQTPPAIDKLYWARTTKVDGTNVDLREAHTVLRLGYRPCTVEDLEERGWGMPPGAHQAADGTIRREDTTLAIVDSDRATRNRERQNAINKDFEKRSIMPDMPRGITGESKLEQQGVGTSLKNAAERLLG